MERKDIDYDRYAEGHTDAEKVLLAVGQLLLGHRHYGQTLTENQVECAELAYEGAQRIALREGSTLPVVKV